MNTTVLKDHKGKVSTARVITLIWAVGVMLIWGYVSVVNKTVADIPSGVLGITVGLSALKVGQTFTEKDIRFGNNQQNNLPPIPPNPPLPTQNPIPKG